jgi:hypothetical protein
LFETQNEASFVSRFLPSICAIQVRDHSDRTAGCRTDPGSSGRTDCGASRSSQSTQQRADADADCRPEGGMSFLGVDLDETELVTVDHSRSVNGDVPSSIKVP